MSMRTQSCCRHRVLFNALQVGVKRNVNSCTVHAAQPNKSQSRDGFDSVALPENFCIIEDRSTVKDFASLQLNEIQDGIQGRRNRIFLLMEEVRRLRIQERLKGSVRTPEEELADDKFISALPFIPQLTESTLTKYYYLYFSSVALIILFGGLIAPILEVKLGLGGTSYTEFITQMHLPSQLSAVDPIVASFCGGAVGVLSALLVVEVNGFTSQRSSRCIYCSGTGYLECATCTGRGCSMCSQTGKVMCTSCLCTGKNLATEYDVRADPF